MITETQPPHPIKRKTMIEFKQEHVTFEELMRAYHDCRKRKRRTENALQFEIDDAAKLYNLWIELNSGTYKIGKSIVFCVDKPVKREVFAADFRDRIVHHLIINRTGRYFEEEFIYDTYSCRKGKGTSLAVSRCEQMMREASGNYTVPMVIVKCDLKSFFMTIDKGVLFEKICRFLKERMHEGEDVDFTLGLVRQVIYNKPQDNCVRKQPKRCWDGLPREKSLFHCDESKGLPIGNLTSQLDANFYLDEFDHWVKEEIGLEYYGRYVDDFFFIVPTAQEATDVLRKFKDKLAETGVRLHPKKLYIQDVGKGVKFVGAVIKPNRIFISNRTKGNFFEAVKRYGEWLDGLLAVGREPTGEQVRHFVSSVNSYLGFLKHYKTYNIRRKVLSGDWMRNWYRYCTVSGDFSKVSMRRKAQRLWMGGTETLRLAA